MATAVASTTRSNFWLEFRVFDDGLDAAAAQRMRSASIQGGGSSVFAQFAQLPAELRLKIWEYMLPPRVVQAACFESETSEGLALSPSSSPRLTSSSSSSSSSVARQQQEEEEGENTYFSSFTSPGTAPALGGNGNGREQWQRQQQVPVLLHVSREARTLALKHYELAFAWKVPHVLAVNSVVPGSYYYPQNHFHAHTTPTSHPSPATNSTTTNTTSTSTPTSSSQPPQPPSTTPRAGSEARTYFNFARDMLYLLGELEPHDGFGFNSPMAYFVARADAARVRRVAVAFRALGYGESGSQQIFGSLFHVVDRFGQGPPAPVRSVSALGAGGTGIGTGENGNGNGKGNWKRGGYLERMQIQEQNENKDRNKNKTGGFIGGRVLIAVTPADEHTHALMGGEGPLVSSPPISPSPSTPQNQESNGTVVNNNNHHHHHHHHHVNGNQDEEEVKDEEGIVGEEEEEEININVVQKIWRDWYRGSIVTSSLAGMKFTLVREDDLGSFL